MSMEEKKKEPLPPEEKEKYHQIYEIAKDSFVEQNNRIDSLDKKAQINLAVIGIVLGFGLFKTELFSDLISRITFQYFINLFQLFTLVASFLLFILSLIFSILSLRPRKFQVYPDISEIMKKFESRNTEDLHASMSAFFQKIIQENEKKMESKFQQLNKGINFILYAFPFAVAFIVLTVVVKILDA